MEIIRLSVLIPTVIGREKKLEKLLSVLNPQLEEIRKEAISWGMNYNPVEIIIDKDNKEVSIGAKRQRLIEKARGTYIVFIDDDDLVSDDYLDQILIPTIQDVDAIGFLIQCTFNGMDRCFARASSDYKDWGEWRDGFRYVRSIYHKTPVKRELALKAGFDDLRFGEDYKYSMRLNPLIKSEIFIDKVLYFYQYEEEDFNKKYGIR